MLTEKQIADLKSDFADHARNAKPSAYSLAPPNPFRWAIRWLSRGKETIRVLRPEITKRQFRALKRANRHDRGALANLREWARPSVSP